MVHTAIVVAPVLRLAPWLGRPTAASPLNLLFDKWKLGPLRVINLLALVVLVIHYGPVSAPLAASRFLEALGAASLAVFVRHLVIALLALTYLGPPSPARPLWVDLLCFSGPAILYLVAWISCRSTAAARLRAIECAAGPLRAVAR